MTSKLGSSTFVVFVEQYWGEEAGGSTLEVETSESVKTSSCIELTSEQEGEQDLVLGGRGGAIDNWHPLGGKGGGLVGDELGVDVKMGRVGSLTISILRPD